MKKISGSGRISSIFSIPKLGLSSRRAGIGVIAVIITLILGSLHLQAALASTLGNTTIGNTADVGGSGYKFGSIFTLAGQSTTTSFKFYASGGSSAQKFIPLVYNVDASNNPTSLVVQGAEVTVAAGQGAGWVTVSIPSTVLPAGTYLIGLLPGPGNASVYYSTQSNASVWNNNGGYPNPSNPWGAVNRSSGNYSFYLDVTAAAPDTISPTIPTNLTAIAASSSQVNLSWTASTDNVAVTGYKIFRGGVQINTSTTNSFSDTTVSPNTTYSYSISAYDAAANNSGQSTPPVSITTPVAPVVTTLGNTIIGSTADIAGSGYKFGSIFTLSNQASATEFKFYVQGGSSSQKFIPLVYSVDASSNPTTLVIQGAEVTVAANQAASWVTVSLPNTVLPAGNYLIGLLPGPGNASVYYSTLANASVWNSNGTYPNPTNPWGAINRSSGNYSLYLNLAASATDATPPTVSLTAPAGGAIVSGIVNVTAIASDDVGVVGVQFKLDGVNLASEDTTSPYAVVWNTTSVSNGSHSLTAVARDASGKSTTAAVVGVTVNNSTAGSVLIITAHPDDETINTAGIIESARAAGRRVYVAVTSNGEFSSSSGTPGYCGTSTDTASGIAQYGLLRDRESVAALGVLGLNRTNDPTTSDIFFLGYPDSGLTTVAGSTTIWTGDSTGLHRTYAEDSDGVNATCNGDLRYQLSGVHSNLNSTDLAADFDSVLALTNPTDVYTHASFDGHPDHRVVYSQLMAAVGRRNVAATIHSTLMHPEGVDSCMDLSAYQWPNPGAPNITDPFARFTPTQDIVAPPTPACSVTPTSTNWGTAGAPNELVLLPTDMQSTSEATNLKWQVISKYVSQIDCTLRGDGTYASSCGYFRGFVKKNEFFWKQVFTPDVTAPVVNLTAPNSGDTVSGTINVTANATDNVGVAGVQFKLDGVNLGAEDTTSPYSINWDTAIISNGSHSLTAVARDVAGNSTSSTAVTVNVNNIVTGTFTDDFTSTTLANGWSFVDPLGNSSYSLSTNSGHLQVTTPSGSSHDCWEGLATCARMMRSTGNTDGTYEIKIDGVNISQQYQEYGLFLVQDTNNFIRFEFGSDPNVKTGAWKIIGGVGSNAIAQQGVTLGSTNYLRVTKLGNTFAMYSSTDGLSWTPRGSVTQAGFNLNQVGIEVGNSSNISTVVNIDYFKITP